MVPDGDPMEEIEAVQRTLARNETRRVVSVEVGDAPAARYVFGMELGLGVAGPLAMPEGWQWVGLGSGSTVWAADAAGTLYRADGWPTVDGAWQVATVWRGATGWAASGSAVVAVNTVPMKRNNVGAGVLFWSDDGVSFHSGNPFAEAERSEFMAEVRSDGTMFAWKFRLALPQPAPVVDSLLTRTKASEWAPVPVESIGDSSLDSDVRSDSTKGSSRFRKRECRGQVFSWTDDEVVSGALRAQRYIPPCELDPPRPAIVAPFLAGPVAIAAVRWQRVPGAQQVVGWPVEGPPVILELPEGCAQPSVVAARDMSVLVCGADDGTGAVFTVDSKSMNWSDEGRVAWPATARNLALVEVADDGSLLLQGEGWATVRSPVPSGAAGAWRLVSLDEWAANCGLRVGPDATVFALRTRSQRPDSDVFRVDVLAVDRNSRVRVVARRISLPIWTSWAQRDRGWNWSAEDGSVEFQMHGGVAEGTVAYRIGRRGLVEATVDDAVDTTRFVRCE